MIALVTGAAGFIGSALADALVEQGWEVRGIDVRPSVRCDGRIEHVRGDLLSADLVAALDGVDAVFHLAGQPGVRTSWSPQSTHLRDNVETTQRLLGATQASGTARFVLASSSSVYGNARAGRSTLREEDPARPISPYGVSKHAAEDLCRVYWDNFGVHTVALRYFTVYGPRQRADMAVHRLIDAALHHTPFELYGDGGQSRDYTYVDDVVAATIAASTAPVAAGSVVNVAGGSSVAMRELIATIEELTDRRIDVRTGAFRPGDVTRTHASIGRAAALLDWRPRTSLREGLAAQIEWHRAVAPTTP